MSEDERFRAQQLHMLSTCDRLYSVVDDIHRTLERKLQFNLALMTTVLSVLILGEVSWFDSEGLTADEHLLFVVFAVCFIGVIVCALFAYVPRDRSLTPIRPDWDTLVKWFQYDISEYSNRMLKAYTIVWDPKDGGRHWKSLATFWSFIFVAFGLGAAIVQSGIHFTG